MHLQQSARQEALLLWISSDRKPAGLQGEVKALD